MKVWVILGTLTVGCLPLAVSADTIKTIRFGVDTSYPPFEAKAVSGELVGFDIDNWATPSARSSMLNACGSRIRSTE